MSTTITGLPNATTPLSGTERVPMDQAGATKDATTQDIANLAPGTDLSYSASTRQLSSSTGADVTLPVAGADAGLMSAADKSKLDAIASGATNTPLSDATPQAPGTAAAGTASSAARADHVHPLPGVATTSAAGLMPASSFAAITYGASVALDMSALDGQVRTISLTGNLELTTSNRATGRTVTLRLIADSTQRTLTFPAGWVFIGSKPANIAASKTGVLSLTFFGSADTDCVAAWGVQA